METTIKIGNKDVKLNNNVGWCMAYRDQFGTDIVLALMPLMASAVDIINGVVNAAAERNGSDEVTLAGIAAVTDGDTLINAASKLAGLELVDFINITWALAKCADESIPSPKIWVRQFDEFPLDEIIPEVFKLIAKGVISSKNLERLKSLIGTLRPLGQALMTSFSQDSKEA